MRRLPTRTTLFPYTTLFRSDARAQGRQITPAEHRITSKQWIIIVCLVLSGREEIPSVTSSDMAPDRSTPQTGVDAASDQPRGDEADDRQHQLNQEQTHVTAVYARLDELRAHAGRRLAEVGRPGD